MKIKTRPALLHLALLLGVVLSSTGPVLSAGRPARLAAPQRQAARRAAALLSFDPAVLVADLNTSTNAAGSGPTGYATLGSAVYFEAYLPGTGSELWRTNGFPAGTRPVADICPGPEGSVSGLTPFGGKLFFSADDCSHGRELWTSDGTVTNTVMVRDIYPGASVDFGGADPLNANPEHFTEFNGALFFAANDGVHGDELWKTDGTYTGTVLVKDIAPGSSSSNISEMVVFSDTLYFVADGGSSNFGEEVWLSDGTEAGTVRLTDISANSGDSDARSLTVVDDLGLMFFTADDDATYGTELWVTDGTPGGTAMVKNIRPGAAEAFPSYLTAFGSLLLFNANDGTDTELWRSDGTEAGTVEIDIYTGGSSLPIGITAYGSVALLAARHQDSAFMPWLWSTDGYTVTKVAEINAGGGANPDFTEVGGQMYFRAYDADSNVEVWKTDGTEAGTALLKEINPTVYSNPNSLYAAPGNHLIFTADDGTHGAEPWLSDGTEAGTQLLADLDAGVGSSQPMELTASGETLFFAASTTTSLTLWQSPDLAGAALVTDVVSLGGAAPIMLGDGEHLLFQGSDGSTGAELWRTNGTPAGTVLVKDIHPSGDAYPQQFTQLGSTVFFVATDADGGDELWATQGTEATTNRVADIRPGTSGSNPDKLTIYDGQLYFFADDGVFGRELWRTDGATTTRLSDAGVDSDSVMGVAGSTLYFTADDSGDGDNVELYQYDGVTVTLAADIHPTESSYPQQLTEAAGSLYFVADDGTHGHELWKFEAGTASLVADVAPGSPSSGVENLRVVGGTLYFTANDGTHGIELWKVEAGVASLVRDIYPGTTGSLPASFVNVANKLIFAAADPQGGYELWQSDGTAAGTARLQEIAPGPRNANPSELTLVGERLYFNAFDITHGAELWGMDVSVEVLYLPVLTR